MLDQAHDLRRLAIERGRANAARAANQPTLVAVAGGKGGVGATTTALSLAAALAKAGKRTLLVDADPYGGDAALRCGIEERYTLADVLEGRQTWAKAIETGLGGIQVVAGARWSEDLENGSSTAAERLLELLNDPTLHADVAVIDVGIGLGRAVERICRTADAIVMVTTSEKAAVVNTFAAIKTLAQLARDRGGVDGLKPVFPLHLFVNMARTIQDVETVQYRIGRACRRLLGIDITIMDPASGCLAIAGAAIRTTDNAETEPSPSSPLKKSDFGSLGATAGLSSSVFPEVPPCTAGQAGHQPKVGRGTLFHQAARRPLNLSPCLSENH